MRRTALPTKLPVQCASRTHLWQAPFLFSTFPPSHQPFEEKAKCHPRTHKDAAAPNSRPQRTKSTLPVGQLSQQTPSPLLAVLSRRSCPLEKPDFLRGLRLMRLESVDVEQDFLGDIHDDERIAFWNLRHARR
eukprot:scaffold2889_cov124-Pinguiococcus_pyrenoidosus.AAC.1